MKPPEVFCPYCGESARYGACACWELLPAATPPTDEEFTKVEIAIELGASSAGDPVGIVMYVRLVDADVRECSKGRYRNIDELARAGFVAVKLFEKAWILSNLQCAEKEFDCEFSNSDGCEMNVYFSTSGDFESVLSNTWFRTDSDEPFSYEEDRSYTSPKVCFKKTRGKPNEYQILVQEEQELERMTRRELINALRDCRQLSLQDSGG